MFKVPTRIGKGGSRTRTERLSSVAGAIPIEKRCRPAGKITELQLARKVWSIRIKTIAIGWERADICLALRRNLLRDEIEFRRQIQSIGFVTIC